MLDRRRLLAWSMIAGGGAMLPHAARGAPLPAFEAPEFILMDQRIGARQRAMLAPSAGVPVIGLGPDLVRQWRDGLREAVTVRGRGVVVFSRWDHAMVLEGLAREERRRSMCDALPGGVFRTQIG